MSEPEVIADAVLAALNVRTDLEGETVLITAGPTQEPLDPVRYISNRSSGRMGYALAEAAAARGARVLLVAGPVHIPEPPGVTLTRVRTAEENAGSGLREFGAGHHRNQGRRRGRLSRRQRAPAKTEEDRRADLTGIGPHTGHPG